VIESRLSGGMQGGAWLVRGSAGAAVLKWIKVDPDDAVRVVEHARSCGYRTPRWLDFGTTDDGQSWCVQEFVEGTPMGDLDVRGAELIVELVALQRTITPTTARTLPTFGGSDELVHSDLAVQNILLRDGVVAGVIDFEEAARGCAVLDLLSPAANAIVWRSDVAAIEVLHRYIRDTYDDATITAASTIVAEQICNWYRRALPGEFARIESAVTEWRDAL